MIENGFIIYYIYVNLIEVKLIPFHSAPSIAEVTPWGGPFGPVTPKQTVTPAEIDAPHPFGESGVPEGEVPSVPENSAAGHPFGEGAAWPEQPGPEGEPEGTPEGQITSWKVYQCTAYSNPFAAPEPEAEPEAEPATGQPYAEPPAPLLQSVNFEERGVYSTLAAVVAGLIIFLNILVLVALIKKPKQRKSLSYLIGLIAGKPYY